MIPLQVQAGPKVAGAAGNVTLTFDAVPQSSEWAVAVLIVNGTRRAAARATIKVDGSPQGITFGIPGQAGPIRVRGRQVLTIDLTGLTVGDSITANAWGHRLEAGEHPLGLGDPSPSGALQIVQALVAGQIDVPDVGLTGLHVDGSGNLGIGGLTAIAGNFLVDAATGNVTIAGTLGITGAVTISSPSVVTVGAGSGQIILDPVTGILTAGKIRLLRVATPATPPASRMDFFGLLQGSRTVPAAVSDDGTVFDLSLGVAGLGTFLGIQTPLTNSTLYTGLASYTMPANFAQVGTVIRLTGWGLTNMPAAPPNIDIELTGGASVQILTFTPIASLRKGFRVEVVIQFSAIGVGGIFIPRMMLQSENATGAGQIVKFDDAAAGNTTTFDTTTPIPFVIRCRMTTAVAAATLSSEEGFVEIVRR